MRVVRDMALLPQLGTAKSTEWQQHGLCQADDAGVFFPPLHFERKPEREVREAKAKQICLRCPVRVQCLEWALEVEEPHGVWGGYSEQERKRMLHGRRKAG